MDKKIIYLSMETKNREYHAKLLFTLYALERGYQVVFGSKYSLNEYVKTAPAGVYIGTGITKALGGDLISAKKAGHHAVSFDEEGLAYINPDVFADTRIKEEIIRDIDHFFTWGERHSELVHKKIPDISNYTAVGNMRLELLKEKYTGIYQDAVNDIKKQYGDFILLNTNLKVYNHVVGRERLFESMRETTFIQTGEDEAFYKDRYAHQEVIFNSYKSLITYLSSKIGSFNIVIRPHTSENKDTWLALSGKNVFVDNSGGVVPWILASNAVIQKNCTTSIETVYLGRPVITYSISFDPRFDNDITNNIGISCKKVNEALTALSDLGVFDKKPSDLHIGQMQRDKEFLSHYAANMSDDKNAAYAILDIIDTLELPSHTSGSSLFVKDNPLISSLKQLKKSAAAVIKSNSTDVRLRQQKFPGLPASEINSDINRFAKTLGMQAGNIQTAKIREDLFYFNLQGSNDGA